MADDDDDDEEEDGLEDERASRMFEARSEEKEGVEYGGVVVFTLASAAALVGEEDGAMWVEGHITVHRGVFDFGEGAGHAFFAKVSRSKRIPAA